MKEQLFENYQNQRWTFVNYKESDLVAVKEEFNLSEVLAKVLMHNAQSSDLTKINNVLSPDYDFLHKFAGISTDLHLRQAAERLKQAQKNNETVFINGDPDADGISGTSILVAGLRQLGFKTSYLFPIRPTEGHGVQVRIIDQAKQAGSSLLITTDCGTKDIQAVDYANKAGVDVIITDHHIIGKKLPDAVAVINPNLVQEDNFLKGVAGATVSFKFIQAMYHYLGVEFPEFLFEFGLIVSALGSISDRVSMLNPINRLVVKYGVDYFFQTEREGIKALKSVSITSKHLTKPRHLSRTIIPRLNAPGRIGNPAENIPDSGVVVDLLLLGKGKRHKAKANHIKQKLELVYDEEEQQMKNEQKALSSAGDVDVVNEKRKQLTADIEDQMDKLIETQVNQAEDRIIILEGQNWNSGVIGIDADRLKERFLRPAIILNFSSESEYVRGSARSIPRINLYALIDSVEQLFLEKFGRMLFQHEVTSNGKTEMVSAFGGHSQACGFSLHKDDVGMFKQLLIEESLTLTKDQFEYHYDVVSSVDISELSEKFIYQLDRFSPYGQQFEFPIFYLENCTLLGGRSFGNRYQKRLKQHVQFSVSGVTQTNKKTILEAVGFGLWEKFCEIKEKQSQSMSKIDLIFRLELDPRSKSNVSSKARVRLNVLDIRLSKASDLTTL